MTDTAEVSDKTADPAAAEDVEACHEIGILVGPAGIGWSRIVMGSG